MKALLFSSHLIVSILLTTLGVFGRGSSALAAAAAANNKMELRYFNARGAAEIIRVMFALQGEEYTDTRYEITPGTMNAPEFVKGKESGALDANMGRAPLLVVENGAGPTAIGQSKAIERFLAKKFQLYGNSDIEAAQIDCIAEHCRDVNDAAMRKGFSAFTRDKTDDEKAAARNEWFTSDLSTLLEKMETAVKLSSGQEGYAVGTATSYADVSIFALLRDCTMQSDQDDTLQAASKCQLLLSIADRIAQEKGVAEWLESRPVTNF
mmetsp:Transcript_13569/g.20028  ORF Transcript_13569/g.20028 Transcript_13569/m.20028 type:complete len:266 (-) Transcript_13569:142-939(-)